jgi:hypothetical protein
VWDNKGKKTKLGLRTTATAPGCSGQYGSEVWIMTRDKRDRPASETKFQRSTLGVIWINNLGNNHDRTYEHATLMRNQMNTNIMVRTRTAYQGKYYNIALRDGYIQVDLKGDGKIRLETQWTSPTP